MFYFWFHCAFIKDNYLCLRKRDLEKACKDTSCKIYSASFKIELIFNSVDDKENQENDKNKENQDKKYCGECNIPITAADNSVSLIKGQFHLECIHCENCGRKFSSKNQRNCIIKDGRATCDQCEFTEFFSKCHSCLRSLTTENIVQFENFAWHKECFRCFTCHKLFDHKKEEEFQFDESKSNLLCADSVNGCKSNRICGLGNACCVKNTPSNREMVKMIESIGKSWHECCFRCVECKKVLSSKSDKYYEKEGNPCCYSHEDNAQSVVEESHDCFVCGKDIQPNKHKLITVFEEYLHDYCFYCQFDGCNEHWDYSKLTENGINNCQEFIQIKQGKLMCKSHDNLFACFSCNKLIFPDNNNPLIIIDTLQSLFYYHFACLCCYICKTTIFQSLAPLLGYVPMNLPHCKKDTFRITFSNDFGRHSRIDMNHVGLDLGSAITIPGNTLKLFTLQNYLPICNKHKKECEKCKQMISDNSELVIVGKKNCFHRDCFSCFYSKCRKLLAIGNFIKIDFNNEQFYYCASHPICNICQFPIKHTEGHEDRLTVTTLDGEELLQDENGQFHAKCYCCFTCKQKIRSAEHSGMYERKLYCISCYPGLTCSYCSKVIDESTGEGHINILKKNNYHLNCFNCSICLEPFPSISEAIKVSEEGKPICKKCSTVLCDYCSKPIDAEFIECEDTAKKFHPNCFRCFLCTSVIANESYGMIDGDIFCIACLKRPVHTLACPICSKVIVLFFFFFSEFNFFKKQTATRDSREMNGKRYHNNCLHCKLCRVDISSVFNGADLLCNQCSSLQRDSNNSFNKIDEIINQPKKQIVSIYDDSQHQTKFLPKHLSARPQLASSFGSHRSSCSNLPASQNAARANTIPSKKGYLKKEGGRIKTVKRRWFVLAGSTLTYSTAPDVNYYYFFFFVNLY